MGEAGHVAGTHDHHEIAVFELLQQCVDGFGVRLDDRHLAMVHRGGQALGSLVLGVTADLIGLRWTAAVGGAICPAFWLWSLRRSRAIAAALEV